MKLKRLPEDFQVEELKTVKETGGGRYTLYRLSKRGLGTLEAIEAICRRWNLSGRQVGYGGLKDRHAVTVQYLTILDGPRRSIREASFDLEPVGRLTRPYGPQDFDGNRFLIVIRDLGAESASAALTTLQSAPAGRASQLFRRPAVWLGGVLGPVHRTCLVEGGGGASPPACPGGAQPL